MNQARVALSLRSSLEDLPGVGPRRAAAYRKAGIHHLRDLLIFPPRRYRSFAPPTPVADLVDGQVSTVRGTLASVSMGRTRRSRVAFRMVIRDPTAEIAAVTFGPAYLGRSLQSGAEVAFKGVVQSSGGRREFRVQDRVDAPADWREPLWIADYTLPGIPAATHRRALRQLLDECAEELRRALLRGTELAQEHRSLAEILRGLHFPTSEAEASRSRRALACQEALLLQRTLQRLRRRRRGRRQIAYPDVTRSREQYVAALGFDLTEDQSRCMAEIETDLASDTPMARLLTGDVGSGKTAVACLPLVVAATAGRQAALLAPTDILARQHHVVLEQLHQRLDLPAPLLVSRGSGSAAVESARDCPVVVGTHRLLGEQLRFEDLATVIIDEQHKFGVRQRFDLWSKGRQPDLLLVSATPIPRTLALTLFGHLEHSELRQRPFGPARIHSEVLGREQRGEVVQRIRAELSAGGQVFVVCPAVEKDTQGPGLPAADEVARWLGTRLRAEGLAVGLLHGRLRPEHKLEVIDRFRAGTCRLLVCTVVVEVGLDVPDASMVVILGAERFGLSQLHQIRGRVGRRGDPASCLLYSADSGARVQARLRAFAATADGFRLAEQDLAGRGPGDLLGLRQSGAFHPVFPEILRDPELLRAALDLARSEGLNTMEDMVLSEDRGRSSRWIW